MQGNMAVVVKDERFSSGKMVVTTLRWMAAPVNRNEDQWFEQGCRNSFVSKRKVRKYGQELKITELGDGSKVTITMTRRKNKQQWPPDSCLS